MKKVKANQTIEVEISPYEEKRLVTEFICENFNWKDSYFIEDDKVMDRVSYHSSHSWTANNFVRNADQFDKCLFNIFKKIKNI